MGLFGDKSKKSWQRLSFGKKQTKAGILDKEETRSQRFWRLVLATCFAAFTTAVVGSCLPYEKADLVGWFGVAGLVFVVHLLMLLLVRAYHRHVLQSLPTYLVVMALCIVSSRLMLLGDDLAFLTPLPCFAMVIALTYGGPLAVHSSLATAVTLGLMMSLGSSEPVESLFSRSAAVVLAQFLGSVVAVLGVTRIRTRTRLMIVGFACGMSQAVAIGVYQLCGVEAADFSTDIALSGEWVRHLADPLRGFANGVISGMIITSLLPFLERWLDLSTDIRLLELADQNRPLLRELSLLAPGSFQHSLMVGQLAEEAAVSIGANDLLARVGALYHDIGKMLKPNYFVENNQAGEENIHDRLSPEMSRLIIISHVKDGIRIAEEEKLPRAIVDMIPMHHGTSVVEYFYHKKRKQEEDKGLGESTRDEAFQYPGPKPTFKEAGILMLADNVEAISRSIDNPTRARLRGIVKEVIRKKMSDGQLDDCELTMNDLHRAEDAFVRVLSSIHHGRIKYPDQQREAAAAAADDTDSGEGEADNGTPGDDRKDGGDGKDGKNGGEGKDGKNRGEGKDRKDGGEGKDGTPVASRAGVSETSRS